MCNDDESNKIISESRNLDSNLRKALLKALTELENEGKDRKSSLTATSIVEKASASAISLYQNHDTETSTQPEKEKNQIVVVQKSNGLQHKPITTFIPSNSSEQFIASASNSFSGIPKRRTNNLNTLPTTEKVENLLSPSPTIETPTTEENEAKVEDVQFFSAPLVAAFTVHQDERGLPKSVEPIYKQNAHTSKANDLVHNVQQEISRQEKLKSEQIKAQIALQEKQKVLEEELYKLQRTQREQQQFLYRQQQLIQEQQQKLFEEREKNRKQHNDQPFIPIIPNNSIQQSQIETDNHFSSHNSNQVTANSPLVHNQISSTNHLPNYNPSHISGTPPTIYNQVASANHLASQTSAPSPAVHNQVSTTHMLANQNLHEMPVSSPTAHNQFETANKVAAPSNHFNSNNPLRSTVVFQSSVSLNPINHNNVLNDLPLNAQHLPTKNFIDFRQTPYVKNSLDQIQSVLVPPHQQTFPNINFLSNTDLPQHQNIRIYRQEPATHFYHNLNPYTRPITYSIQPSVPLNVRYLRSNPENYQTSVGLPAQPPIVKQQLTNLLYNSGINTGKQEDLDIISKVLSYNHVGGNTRFYTPFQS
ncbi:hypothetical protein MML48_6g00013766 [Holotrichia oblita]|uniref:Uncharacterized protein n=1 Tax=Holotrichia oblita TaxID=644536 RepID=A0ACB9SY09_HOLOL|nr:hypothetical protein MML48_6g00013766 [Holotrichia oblita]